MKRVTALQIAGRGGSGARPVTAKPRRGDGEILVSSPSAAAAAAVAATAPCLIYHLLSLSRSKLPKRNAFFCRSVALRRQALPPEKPSGETQATSTAATRLEGNGFNLETPQGFQRGAQSLLLLLPPPLPGSPSHPAEPTSGIVPSNERNGPESGSPTAKTLRCRQVYHEATEFYGEIWQRHQEAHVRGVV
ncbi:unnamed protein product [Lampetra fluviatilis]